MYQFTEEKVKWDDYGEIIRPEDYMIIEAPLPGSDVKKEETDSGSVEICHPEVGTEFPTKCIRYLQSLEVLAKVCFIDFEGR